MARGTLAALALAFVLRAAVFPFADNKHGDAPMRALIAERMVLEPGSAAEPRTYCQFGPLHTTLMRPFIAVDPLASRSSRLLSLLAGLAVFFPFAAFARRVAGEGRRRARAASRSRSRRCTSRRRPRRPARRCTCCSGSPRSSGCWRALADGGRAGTFALAGLLASLAAVTRYDAWLALPLMVLAALVFARAARCARAARAGAVLALRGGAARGLARVGRRAPAAIPCSSRTTSRPTTPSWPPTSPAAFGPCWGARASSASGRSPSWRR